MIFRKQLTASLWLLIALPGFSQQELLSAAVTTKLDSVTMCPGRERHFGELYLQATYLTDAYIETLPEQGKLLMKRLEESFVTYFFRAINANNSGIEIPDEWKNYFTGDYSPLQLKLIGANAHINGDIWQALTENFSIEEIRQVTPYYRKFNKYIRRSFDRLFQSGRMSDKRLRHLHLITLGADKLYGKMMLKKWRNRQLRLAILKFEHPNRFAVMKKRIDKKRHRIDRMIIRRLQVNE
jgi:hypothetical protein